MESETQTEWTPVSPREKRVSNKPGSWTNPTGSLIRELAPDIWVVERSYVDFTGWDVGGKMTIIRLSGNRLLIHSALPLTPELKQQIDALGTVSFIVAPSDQHIDFVGHWKKHYPAAMAIAPPGLKAKKPDIPFDEEIHPVTGHPAWKDEGLEHVYVAGVPICNETVFFHVPSKSLLVTDLAFLFPEDVGFWTRCLHRFAASVFGALYHWFFIKDRRAWKDSIDRIENWDFETLIPTHGQVVTENAKDEFKLRSWS